MTSAGPRARDRRRRRQKRDRHYRAVCAVVDQRDGPQCRACKRWVEGRAHHHHLVFRSHGGADSASNVIRLCPECHDRVHRRRLLVRGRTAETVTFEVAP